MKSLILVVLIAILIMLCSIRIAIEDLSVNLLEPSRVTEVRHIYNYDVESYGTIRLNDKLTLAK